MSEREIGSSSEASGPLLPHRFAASALLSSSPLVLEVSLLPGYLKRYGPGSPLSRSLPLVSPGGKRFGNKCVQTGNAKFRKSQIVLLSLVSILAAGLLADPSIAYLLLEANEVTPHEMGPNSSELLVAIPSMDCPACAVGIQSELNNIDGIEQAQISCESKRAAIIYSSEKVTQSTIMEAIRETGFPPEEIKR